MGRIFGAGGNEFIFSVGYAWSCHALENSKPAADAAQSQKDFWQNGNKFYRHLLVSTLSNDLFDLCNANKFRFDRIRVFSFLSVSRNAGYKSSVKCGCCYVSVSQSAWPPLQVHPQHNHQIVPSHSGYRARAPCTENLGQEGDVMEKDFFASPIRESTRITQENK
ncbi:uncharacterized protein G2W53_039591 [Senna tora]|uniref:Uncharacterized protein n=1 Tax=Senna tora TaxID=362788 RepID=A0A834SMT7_9FABA|nr:uncharacterized protein G2W53_039591 [Senna tora]